MRRITMWITATIAVVAMITYYQVGSSGESKDGERGSAPAAQCGGDDPCAEDDHTDEPGEGK